MSLNPDHDRIVPAMCNRCRFRESREWLLKENDRLRKVIIEERQGRGLYPLITYVGGDLVERGEIW